MFLLVVNEMEIFRVDRVLLLARLFRFSAIATGTRFLFRLVDDVDVWTRLFLVLGESCMG